MPDPFPKSKQLARGERRYRRKVASPKQWAAIRAEKGQTCRLWAASVGSWCGGGPRDVHPHRGEWVQMHHLVSRGAGLGDDLADNLVPLCPLHHGLITRRAPAELRLLATRLTDAEYAYVVGKLGEGAMARLFGV